MSGIAEVLLALGFKVSGSDVRLSPTTARLEKLGARVFEGHDPKNLNDSSCVVVSSAISQENPEWSQALSKGIPVIARAEMLAELMRLKMGVAVAGSHGKTTTTSILGQILRPLDPTVVVGGRIQNWDASSRVGKGEAFVIEADESDRSFLKFSPVYTIVTNIDLEHLETYSGIEDIQETFTRFLNRTAFFGVNWISSDCPRLKEIRPHVSKPLRTYGFDEDSDLRISNLEFKKRKSHFELSFKDGSLGKFEMALVGKHNVMNAAGAIGMALTLGMKPGAIREELKRFIPADRRLQIHFEDEKMAVVEDYGHHPTEIKATLEALNLLYPQREKVIYFQPHRYSRTKALWNYFAESFKDNCDHLYMLPIYAAHEKAIKGVSSIELAKTFKGISVVVLDKTPEVSEIFRHLEKGKSSSRVILILGAGPLTQLAIKLGAGVRHRNKDLSLNARFTGGV